MREKLREIRTKRGMTQQDVANEVGIDRSYYANIELGRYNPSLKNAMRIKEALKYKSDDIFYLASSETEQSEKQRGL